MKIYQVEELVGITKKNIRFYEEQGLLCPSRNPENDYREYSLADVKILEKIKLLRKLSVPIEEIRLLQKGQLPFVQSMTQQIERIEKEQQNAEVMKGLCIRLRDEAVDINALDASQYLMEMEKLEQQGTKFKDIEKDDINRKKKTGAIAAAAIFCAFMLMMLGILAYGVIGDSAPVLSMLVPGIIILSVLIGIIVVLIQRIKEIDGGEEYDARKY
ncbi:MAG: MerR family transcriptional regulator [Spirochaetaceae bacterium]|nr:MerR family transcriptional regulator [Spirochaetaceae bacterium]